ncbi:MAG TPA: extracellular solute-binding protein [Verrucomicrobiae bacterium]|nr:extracellular solute-binding protein [Verrucomicrobiae bacterium]
MWGRLAWVVLGLGWGAAARGAEPEVVVFSPHSTDIRRETGWAFSAWHRAHYGGPAVVRWRDCGGGTSQILRFIRSEYGGRVGGIGVDVMYGGGVDPFLELKEARLLARWNPVPGTLEGVPGSIGGVPMYDSDHEWFAAALSGFGIVSNRRVFGLLGLPEVRTWVDLADPRLAGWVGAADPRQSGTALAVFEIILQAYGFERGWAIIAAICGNSRAFLHTAALPTKDCALGEVACAMSVDIYGWSNVARLGSENMAFVLPEGVTVINPDGIAILRDPPHPQLASRFLEFVLSRPGQLLWMLPHGVPGGSMGHDINRMSVMPDLYGELRGVTPVRVNPFTQQQTFRYDPAKGMRRRRILAGVLGAVFIDLHPLVRRAWREIQGSPRRGELVAEYCVPIVSEEELFRLGDGDWNERGARQALINRWQREAGAKWRRIEREARER